MGGAAVGVTHNKFKKWHKTFYDNLSTSIKLHEIEKLIVISSAIMVQGKVKEYQNLVFKILGFSKKEIIFSSLIEFIIIFKSVILIAIFFAVIASKFIMENIFELVWAFDFKVLFNLGLSIGLVTLALILITNLKYLSPKVYPLIRNQ